MKRSSSCCVVSCCAREGDVVLVKRPFWTWSCSGSEQGEEQCLNKTTHFGSRLIIPTLTALDPRFHNAIVLQRACSSMSLAERFRARAGLRNTENGSNIPRSKSFAGALHKRLGSQETFEITDENRRSPTPQRRLLHGLAATWSGRHHGPPGGATGNKGGPTNVPRPGRAMALFDALQQGLEECIERTREDIEERKAAWEGLTETASQQLKFAERYLKTLECQLLRLEELRELYDRQQKMRDGVRSMAFAYVQSPGDERAQGLQGVRSGFRDCTDDLVTIEHQLERSMMGTLRFELKEIQGFARICPGDNFEVTIKHGDQKWRTRGRVQKDESQVWDSREKVFKPLFSEFLHIKAVELKGLGKNVLLGNKSCEIKDLFSSFPQLMTINLCSSGSLKLNLVVTWNPLVGEGDEGSGTGGKGSLPRSVKGSPITRHWSTHSSTASNLDSPTPTYGEMSDSLYSNACVRSNPLYVATNSGDESSPERATNYPTGTSSLPRQLVRVSAVGKSAAASSRSKTPEAPRSVPEPPKQVVAKPPVYGATFGTQHSFYTDVAPSVLRNSQHYPPPSPSNGNNRGGSFYGGDSNTGGGTDSVRGVSKLYSRTSQIYGDDTGGNNVGGTSWNVSENGNAGGTPGGHNGTDTNGAASRVASYRVSAAEISRPPVIATSNTPLNTTSFTTFGHVGGSNRTSGNVGTNNNTGVNTGVNTTTTTTDQNRLSGNFTGVNGLPPRPVPPNNSGTGSISSHKSTISQHSTTYQPHHINRASSLLQSMHSRPAAHRWRSLGYPTPPANTCINASTTSGISPPASLRSPSALNNANNASRMGTLGLPLPQAPTVHEAVQNLSACLEDIQGQYPELHSLEQSVQELDRLLRKRYNSTGSTVMTRNDSEHSNLSGLDDALECFDFLDDEALDPGSTHSTLSRRHPSPLITDGGDSGLGQSQRSSPNWADRLNIPTTGSVALDWAIVAHCDYCAHLLDGVGGAIGPLRARETRCLAHLRRHCHYMVALQRMAYHATNAEYKPAGSRLIDDLSVRYMWEKVAGTECMIVPLCYIEDKLAPIMANLVVNKGFAAQVTRALLAHMLDGFPLETGTPVSVFLFKEYFDALPDVDAHMRQLEEEVKILQCLQEGEPVLVKRALGILKNREPVHVFVLPLVEMMASASHGSKLRKYVEAYLKQMWSYSRDYRIKLFEILVAGLEDIRAPCRQSCCVALSHLRAIEALPHLSQVASNDDNYQVKQQAKEALYSFGEEGRKEYQQSQLFAHGFQGLSVS